MIACCFDLLYIPTFGRVLVRRTLYDARRLDHTRDTLRYGYAVPVFKR
jgi:hypothetical protein